METSVLGGCLCDGLWTRGGKGESGLGSKTTVGSLSSSRVTTYEEQMEPLNMFNNYYPSYTWIQKIT